MAEGINAERAFLSLNGGEPVALAQRGYEGALQAIAGALAQRDLIDSVALIGHRVAHGGDLFTESVIISEEVINNIRRVSSPLRCITTPVSAALLRRSGCSRR